MLGLIDSRGIQVGGLQGDDACLVPRDAQMFEHRQRGATADDFAKAGEDSFEFGGGEFDGDGIHGGSFRLQKAGQPCLRKTGLAGGCVGVGVVECRQLATLRGLLQALPLCARLID